MLFLLKSLSLFSETELKQMISGHGSSWKVGEMYKSLLVSFLDAAMQWAFVWLSQVSCFPLPIRVGLEQCIFHCKVELTKGGKLTYVALKSLRYFTLLIFPLKNI